MDRKLGGLIAALCLLSACVTEGAYYPDPQQVGQAIGSRWSGRPITDMMATYGAPIRQMQVGSETVYSWEVSHTQYFQTQPPAITHCQMDAYVRSDNVVRAVGLSGQNGACPEFMR